MKRQFRLRCSGFSILFLLICIFESIGYNDATEDNIERYLDKSSESVANFVENNLSSFVAKYKEETSDEWNAYFIENKKIVIDIDTLENYVFLDFNDDNGYASDLIHEGFGTFVVVKDYLW